MYFKEKNTTNIDDEFSNKNSLSQLVMNLHKYKIFIFSFVIIIIIMIIGLLIINKKDNNYLVLNGDYDLTIYEGDDYIEEGYNAYNDKKVDLSSNVIIETNLNTKKVGIYEIKYKLGNITKIRKVTVIKKDDTYTYIRLNAVENDINIYLKLGDKYVEPGYHVYSNNNENLYDKVIITGNVDTNKKGSYKLVYSVSDSNGVTVSKSRMVYVMDTEINLSLDNTNWTNSDVIIKVNIDDEMFDYMILPDGSKITKNVYSYKVKENGKYTFKTYSKKGLNKEKTIEVSNIDREIPKGSCSGSFSNGKSYININASDNVEIKKYQVLGVNYIDNVINLSREVTNVEVKIYDKAGNVKSVSCSLKDNNKPILFGKDIKLDYQYVKDSDLQYALYSPNIDNKNKKIPLIVWLHGSGEVGVYESVFKSSGLLSVLNEWNLEGFNAYVLCPRLSSGTWNNQTSENNLFNLIGKIVTEKNVDTKKIIITGHSLGGIGVQYMAIQRQNYFSSMVVLSGYSTGLDLNQIKKMPALGYSESSGTSYSYMMGTFVPVFGKDKLTVYNAYHGSIPKLAFTEDKNGDGRSDLIEWMLNQELK